MPCTRFFATIILYLIIFVLLVVGIITSWSLFSGGYNSLPFVRVVDMTYIVDANRGIFYSMNGQWVVESSDAALLEQLSQDLLPEEQICCLAWSPDSEQVIYVVSRVIENNEYENARGAIYLADKTGQMKRRITDELNDIYQPTWSPDGRYIAYQLTFYDQGVYAIDMQSVNAEPSQIPENRLLARAAYWNWHPNSQQIVYTAAHGGFRSLMRIDDALYTVDVQSQQIKQALEFIPETYQPTVRQFP